MGLRITDNKKSNAAKRAKETLRDHLIEIEAKKWSESRTGNFEELHYDFLKKVKDMRALLASSALATSMVKALEQKIRNDEEPSLSMQNTIDPKTILELL
jgi:hypothetical protein